MRFYKTIGCFILGMGVSMLSSAQDLLAKQAPLDEQMKSVDSIAVKRMLLNEHANFDYDDEMFTDWDNKIIHYSAELPDSFSIDLTGFCMPVPNTRINDIYGYRPRRRRIHYGLDVDLNTGDTVRAAFSGKVHVVNYQRRGYGYYISIRHDNGLETVYGHLSRQLVKEDEIVEAGTPIGLGGSTGHSTGPHLHFETVFKGHAIDPALLFDFTRQDVTCDNYTFYKSKFAALAKASKDKVTKAKKTKSSSKTTATPSGKGSYHKVRSGDTLSAIAQRYGTSVNNLCKLNGISQKTVLKLGRSLRYK